MAGIVELLDVERIVFELDHGSLILIHVAIVGCTENGDDLREVS